MKARPGGINMMCFKNSVIPYLCEARVSKWKVAFPKWWCFRCKRYILPDQYHRPIFDAPAGDSQRSHEVAEDIKSTPEGESR